MSKYYNRPIYGHAFKPFSSETVEVKKEDLDSWNFRRLVSWGRKSYALFHNSKNEQIMQSLAAIRFIRCKPGEENINAKLSNEQGIEVFQRAMAGESHEDLAEEFDITTGTVSRIKNLRARTRVTLDFLNGNEKKAVKTAVIVAKRNKGKKLSLSLARMVRSDFAVQRISIKELAKKYCVSVRTIQRILKNEMYKE